jgi:hypothetical protein
MAHTTMVQARQGGCRLLLGLVVCALLGQVARPALAAGDKDKAAARAHYATATRFFEVREWEDALKEYKAAYVAWPDPAFLFNIGQCLRKLDRNAEALDFFQQYLKKAPADDPNRPQVEARIRNIEAGLSADEDPFAKGEGSKAAPAAAPAPARTPAAAPAPAPTPPPAVPPAPFPGTPAASVPAPPPAAPVPPLPTPTPTPAPEPVAAPAQPAGVDLTAAATPPEEPTPIFKTWWFWTGVGAVVVAGAVTAVVLASRGGGTSVPDSSLGARPVFP